MTHIASQRLVLIGLLLSFISMPLLGEENQEDGARSQPSERRFLGELLEALSHDTVGPRGRPVETAYLPSPQVVTPPGSYALSIDGDFDLGGFVFKDGVPFLHNDGGYAYGNTALGLNALVSATPGVPFALSGGNNTAVGNSALRDNTRGFHNTALGASTLLFNTTGRRNTAVGESALRNNTTGFGNTASGSKALYSNSTGDNNTASGASALNSNTTGSSNIAVGFAAGHYWTTGSYNIAVGTGASGVVAESNTIRIGYAQRQGDDHLRSFTLGKAIETVDWDAITETVEHGGVTYKKVLLAVVYTSG